MCGNYQLYKVSFLNIYLFEWQRNRDDETEKMRGRVNRPPADVNGCNLGLD